MKFFESFIARRYFLAQRKNLSSGVIAIFSATGVMLGTWLLIFVLSAINGFENEVKRQLVGKDAHLEVTLYGYEPMRNFDSILTIVRQTPSVTKVAPFITTKTIISKGNNQDGIIVFGIDPQASKGVIDVQSSIKTGSLTFDSIAPSDSAQFYPGIVLGNSLAIRLGVGIGEKVFLADFSEAGGLGGAPMAPKIHVFRVAGTFESGMYQYDENLAYMGIEQAQRVFRMPNAVTGIQARVEDWETSGRIARDLQENLGYPHRVVDWKAKNLTLIKWMGYEKIIVGLALGIIIIIAAFNIISSLVMSVNDKKREIGILRAMGATRISVLKIFMFEGSMIGLFGSLVGLVLGLISYWIQHEYGIIRLPSDVYFVTVLPVELKISDVLIVLVGTNILCAIAAIIPAFKAAKQDPVEAIRHE